MNVCMIATTYPRFEGDTAAPFIASIAEGMAALGHTVDMVVPYHPLLHAGERNGVRLHAYRVPGDETEPLWGYAQSMQADVKVKRKAMFLAPLALRSTYRKCLEAAARTSPELVHAHWALPNGFVGARLARRLRVPLVVSLHGSDMYLARRNAVFRRFAAAVLKRAAVVTACSPDLKEQAEAISGRAVELTEYGVDTVQFHPPPSPPSGRSVFAVGRLVYKKGFLPLLDAFAKIHTYYPDSTLVIAGAGELLAELQERARALGLSKYVSFPGDVDRRSLPERFRNADIAAVPSITDEFGNRDGLPNVLLEAMASGCAVVATDIPGIRNVMEDGREGRVVREGDIDALAGALSSLLGDPQLRQTLGKCAREKAVSELSWEVKCKQLDDIYRRVAP